MDDPTRTSLSSNGAAEAAPVECLLCDKQFDHSIELDFHLFVDSSSCKAIMEGDVPGIKSLGLDDKSGYSGTTGTSKIPVGHVDRSFQTLTREKHSFHSKEVLEQEESGATEYRNEEGR